MFSVSSSFLVSVETTSLLLIKKLNKNSRTGSGAATLWIAGAAQEDLKSACVSEGLVSVGSRCVHMLYSYVFIFSQKVVFDFIFIVKESNNITICESA